MQDCVRLWNLILGLTKPLSFKGRLHLPCQSLAVTGKRRAMAVLDTLAAVKCCFCSESTCSPERGWALFEDVNKRSHKVTDPSGLNKADYSRDTKEISLTLSLSDPSSPLTKAVSPCGGHFPKAPAQKNYAEATRFLLMGLVSQKPNHTYNGPCGTAVLILKESYIWLTNREVSEKKIQ